MKMFKVFIFLLLILLIGNPSFSSDNIDDEESYAFYEEIKDGFEYRIKTLVFGNVTEPQNSPLNPHNRLLEIDKYRYMTEIRPDFSLNFRNLYISVKPRFYYSYALPSKETETDIKVNEYLFQTMLQENIFVFYGRENLLWGPSFLFSPSNPFFMDTGKTRPKQEVPGKDFARLVYMASDSITMSLIANTGKGNSKEINFRQKGAVKIDFTGESSYGGVIFSVDEEKDVRGGFYYGKTVNDALLVYCEGGLQTGSDAYYPKQAPTPFSYSLEKKHEDSKVLYGRFLFGGSYTFKNEISLTAEYLYNGTGLSDDETRLYTDLIEEAGTTYENKGVYQDLSRQLLGRGADNGHHFLRKNIMMIQLLRSDIFDMIDLTGRWIYCLDDTSSNIYGSAGFELSDYVDFTLSGFTNTGNWNHCYGGLVSYGVFAGFELSF